MATITQIEIDGFKAFPANFKLDLETGKNLLLYGENGSGKSSVYYALHALLQSVFKEDKGQKYLIPGRNVGGTFIPEPENLIHTSRFEDAKNNANLPFVKIIFEDGKIWRLDQGGLSSENGGDESEIRMLNKDSAFINHSYISRFHSARNSEEIDLWNVFYKDILPFHLPIGRTQFLADFYDQIASECNGGVSMRNKALQTKIMQFNTLLSDVINKINTRVSLIYNDNFKNDGDDSLEIKLIYYGDDDQDNKLREHFYLYYGNIRNNKTTRKAELYPPKIGVEIKEGGILIYKPQSHFNEAKLTAIALSVRFACMPTAGVQPGSFLALDDMLISLDMSNRLKVIRFLLHKMVSIYKIYVFTHDRLFYHTFKRTIETQFDKSKWVFGGLYLNDLNIPIEPEFLPDTTSKIVLARDAYTRHDYFRCGTLLRQELERLLSELLPESYRIREDPATKATISKNLDEQIGSLEEFCKCEQIDFKTFQDLKLYKDLFMNSTAHNDITSPFYRQEIKSCLYAIETLSQIARSREVRCKRDLSFSIKSIDDKIHTIRVRMREPLLLLEYDGNCRVSYYSKCEILKVINDIGEESIMKGYNSLYVAYNDMCVKFGVSPVYQLLDLLSDRDGPLIARV